MLQAWAEATADLDEGGDDVDMVAGDDDDDEMKPKVTKEFEPLKRCFEEFRPRFEGNGWTSSVLEATY